MKISRRFVQMAVLFALLVGCDRSPQNAVSKAYAPSADKDVTNSSEFNFAPFVGTVWKTKVKTGVAEMKRYTGAPETKLLAPDFETPDPRFNDRKIIDVLPPGTRLRMNRLLQDQGAWGGVQVEAIVLDATKGDRAVILDPMLLAGNAWSRGPTSNGTWAGDPDRLEKAN